MTAVQPPAFMQNLTNHNAETDRGTTSALLAGTPLTSTDLKGRGGIHNVQGQSFLVSQNGVPNMSVNVGSGVAFIPGTEGSKQGVYTVVNDATVNVPLAAADPAQPRIDLIVLRVRDQVYSGANNDWLIDKVTGVASASPAIPVAPANSLTLARLAVSAADTSIVTGDITDVRQYAAALGGTIYCTSTTRPDPSTVANGQEIYEFDTELSYRIFGSTWKLASPYRKEITLGAPGNTFTFSGIPTTLKKLELWYSIRGDASATGNVFIRINNDSGANYSWQTFNTFTLNQSNTSAITQTSWNIGAIPTGAGAGEWGCGVLTMPGWNAPHASYLPMIAQTGYIFNATGGSNNQYLNGGYKGSSGSGYTSITVFTPAGNFQAGSQVIIEGWDY
jgi:hypothetical protein